MSAPVYAIARTRASRLVTIRGWNRNGIRASSGVRSAFTPLQRRQAPATRTLVVNFKVTVCLGVLVYDVCWHVRFLRGELMSCKRGLEAVVSRVCFDAPQAVSDDDAGPFTFSSQASSRARCQRNYARNSVPARHQGLREHANIGRLGRGARPSSLVSRA